MSTWDVTWQFPLCTRFFSFATNNTIKQSSHQWTSSSSGGQVHPLMGSCQCLEAFWALSPWEWIVPQKFSLWKGNIDAIKCSIQHRMGSHKKSSLTKKNHNSIFCVIQEWAEQAEMIDNQLVHGSRQTPPCLYHKQLSESVTELCFSLCQERSLRPSSEQAVIWHSTHSRCGHQRFVLKAVLRPL